VAKREDVLHWAAPVAFLAAVTIAALLIRGGLSGGGAPTTTASVTTSATTTAVAVTTTAAATTGGATTSAAGPKLYVVQTGDTYGSIAGAHGATVQELERLNPGVSSTALTVGQKIRIR
jgi:LysM repeat protein